MANIVQYSPWQDAASFGQGLGATISKILFTLPQMRQQQFQQERDYQLDQRRVAAQEQMARSHASLYQAQEANIPVTNEQKDAGIAERTLLHAMAMKLMGARADDLVAQQPSKIAERQARTGMLDTQRSLYPDIQNHKFGLQDSLTAQAQARTANIPEHEKNYGKIARAQAALAGVDDEEPQQQPSLYPTNTPSTGQGIPTPPASGAPPMRFKLRDPATGKLYMGTLQDHLANPHLEIVEEL